MSWHSPMSDETSTPRPRTACALAAVLWMLADAASAEGSVPICDILTAQQVSTLVGRPMETTGVEKSRSGEHSTLCKFTGENAKAEIRVIRTGSEQAAIRQYRETMNATAGDAVTNQPLHGVGTESRLRSTKTGLIIVARFGTYVVVASTDAGRPVVVGLVRAAGSRMTFQ